MHHPSPLAGLKPAALAVALALCGAPMALQAATITLSASYSMNGGALRDGLTDPDAQFSGATPPYPTGTGSDFYLTKQDGVSNVFFHTYGFVSEPTYFGARSSGEGQWSTSTTANYNTQFTNGGLAALPLSLSFVVDSGDLGLFGTGTGQAELILRVRVNGVDVARDKTTISSNGSGFTCTEDDLGATLASYTSCGGNGNANQAFSSGGLYTVDLGLVEAGRSVLVDYDIIATTSGSFTSGAVNCNYQGYGGYEGYGGYGELTLVTEGPSSCPTFNGISRSGDPFNLPLTDADPGTPFDPRFNVPAPGSLALAGLATVIAAVTRRRRLRQQR